MRKYLLTMIAMLGLTMGAARAADFKPAVVFDMAGKFDKSFNEGVFNGVEKFRKETGIKYREFEVTNTTSMEVQTIDRGTTSNFSLSLLGGTTMQEYSTTYAVRVSIDGGTVYGPSCNVTTTDPPPPTLNANSCGATDINASTILYSENVGAAAKGWNKDIEDRKRQDDESYDRAIAQVEGMIEFLDENLRKTTSGPAYYERLESFYEEGSFEPQNFQDMLFEFR